VRKNNKYLISVIFVLSLVLLNTGMGSSANAAGRDRIGGKNRCSTAIEISKSGWNDGSASNVILATSASYPDALCAAPLAKRLDAPILLVEKSTLSQELENEITRLGANNAYIIGEKDVISDSFKEKLEQKGITVHRIGGKDRYQTSLEIAKYMYSNSGYIETIAVATGEDFPDALSISSIAACKDMPILLTSKKQLDEDIVDFIKLKNVTNSYVVGGDKVIGENILSKLPSPKRLAGANRYETNIETLKEFSDNLNYDTVYVATGYDFPDALSSSSLAAKTNSPVVLTTNSPYNITNNYILSNFNNIKNVVAIGGVNAVPDSTLKMLSPRISSIGDETYSIAPGDSFFLKENMEAKLDNGYKVKVPVTWDTDYVDTSEAGYFEFYGTVDGYSKTIKVILNILDKYKHPIMGQADLTAEQMAKYLLSKEEDPKINPKEGSAPYVDVVEFAQMFLDEGAAEGVRGDIAFAHSIKETGNFRFGGQVLPEQYNYAGMGATNNSPVGKSAWFKDQREGIRAQIQHLKAYATKVSLNNECVDPRYDILVQKGYIGTAPNWEDLNGKWAVPGDGYGESVLSIYERIKTFR